jgi:hypothetical protein
MLRAWVLLLGVGLLSATALPREDGLAAAVEAHDHHPGLGHPEEGEGEHHHGDPDDHHESPDSPCHHHDEHTCCTASPLLGLPASSTSFEAHLGGYLSCPSREPRVLPTVRELFHVPLA